MLALMRFGVAFAGLSLLLAAQGAPAVAEDDDVVLQPSGPWRLDLRDGRCRLLRILGPEDNRHIIYFEQYGPSRHFVINAAGPEFRKFRQANRVDIGLGQFLKEDRGRVGRHGDWGYSIYATHLAVTQTGESGEARQPFRINSSALQGASYVRFVWGRRSLRLETRDLEAPLEALNQCSQNLIAGYDIDFEAQLTRQSAPEWQNRYDIAERIKDEFPREAIKRGQIADVRLLTIVDEEGQVAECHVFNMLQFPDVQERVCGIMQDAQYLPARDAAGEPMRSFDAITIVYRLGR